MTIPRSKSDKMIEDVGAGRASNIFYMFRSLDLKAMYLFLTNTGTVGQVLHRRDACLSCRTLLSSCSKQIPLFILLLEIAALKPALMNGLVATSAVVPERPGSQNHRITE